MWQKWDIIIEKKPQFTKLKNNKILIKMTKKQIQRYFILVGDPLNFENVSMYFSYNNFCCSVKNPENIRYKIDKFGNYFFTIELDKFDKNKMNFLF